MSSIYDMYLRDNIMSQCNDYFNRHLEEEGLPEECLTELEKKLMYIQIDNLIALITNIYKEHKDEDAAMTAIIDKLIGICVVGKMNEARLCRLLNMAMKED